MGSEHLSDTHLAHGLPALRKRYIRRAHFLRDNRSFRETCARERAAWNHIHTRYTLPAKMHEEGFPAALMRDYPAACLAFERVESRRSDLPDELDSAKDHFEYECEKWQRRSQDSTLGAYDEWKSMVWRLADEYFPREDYPVFSEDRDHPAAAFLGWALGSIDWQVLERQIETLITVSLAVSETLAMEEAEDPLLVLGLYPGITANDIKDSATEIAERVNRLYADRVPLARVRALRSQGLTEQAIGDRLGLSRRAVGDALTHRDKK